MDRHQRTAAHGQPGYLVSMLGWLRPGASTAREGAAGATTSAGLVMVLGLAATVVVARRLRR